MGWRQPGHFTHRPSVRTFFAPASGPFSVAGPPADDSYSPLSRLNQDIPNPIVNGSAASHRLVFAGGETVALRKYASSPSIQSWRGGLKMSSATESSSAVTSCGTCGGMQRISPARTAISFPSMRNLQRALDHMADLLVKMVVHGHNRAFLQHDAGQHGVRAHHILPRHQRVQLLRRNIGPTVMYVLSATLSPSCFDSLLNTRFLAAPGFPSGRRASPRASRSRYRPAPPAAGAHCGRSGSHAPSPAFPSAPRPPPPGPASCS